MEISLPLVVFLLFIVFLLLLYGNISRGKKLRASFLTTPEDESNREPQDDSWEGSFSEAENPKTLSITLEFDYQDGSGLQSHRRVRVLEFDNELHGGILIAHCQLRDAMRTFRFNRIQACVDAAGKPVKDVATYLNFMFDSQVQTASKLVD